MYAVIIRTDGKDAIVGVRHSADEALVLLRVWYQKAWDDEDDESRLCDPDPRTATEADINEWWGGNKVSYWVGIVPVETEEG